MNNLNKLIGAKMDIKAICDHVYSSKAMSDVFTVRTNVE
jgi:hypothetical protein